MVQDGLEEWVGGFINPMNCAVCAKAAEGTTAQLRRGESEGGRAGRSTK